jgi:hypothetical protein
MPAPDRQFLNQAFGAAAPIVDLQLTTVAPSQICEHSAFTSKGSWRGMFDIAVWLHTPAGVTQPLQLALRYRDAAGVQTIHIDRCGHGSHRTVLLNGSQPLRVQGAVQEAALYLVGVDPDIVVSLEEWHLVPQPRRAGLAGRLAPAA